MPSSLSLIIFSFCERCATLPFSWILRGHCRVTNWPNFNIAVVQGLGRLKEKERDGGTTVGPTEQSEHTHLSTKVGNLYGCCLWHPETNYSGDSKDCWWQITTTKLIMQSLKYFKNYQVVAQRCKTSKCYWKNGADWWARHRAATYLQFVKKKQYEQSSIKWAPVKQSTPVCKCGVLGL